jgi:peptidoglycan endopeptidase LytE
MRRWKVEAVVLCGVVVFVLCLPFVAVLSITNVSALAESIIPSSNGPSATNISLYDGPGYKGDAYAFGNCTYWVFMRRAEIGELIPTTWGNAATCATRAASGGYAVDHTPSQYAIMQTPNVDNGLGHVAFVESVDPDGTWHISEMNVVGFDEIDYKAMPASSAASYNFIHEAQ